VKYTYCPPCNRLQKWNWYSRNTCENCNKECVVFDVKRSVFGVLMYALCAIAVVLIIFHASWYTLDLEWASFYSAVPEDISTWSIFGLLLLAIVFTFIDLAKTQKKAEERLREGVNRPK
jgi:hypothetical protein